jgi:Zn-dependent peptidase ImmA (M78 family)
MAGFNPEVFKWARESAGLDVGEAAKALHIKPESLEGVEAGIEPSRPLLLRMTQVYRRSLLTFYLPEPPKKGNRGQDFRTVIPDQHVEAEVEIDVLIRDLLARQSLVRSVLEDEEEIRPVPFVGAVSMEQGVGAVAQSIQQVLGFDRAQFRGHATTEQAFGFLRSLAERAGVFVLLIGNLGSHHTAIPVSAFRGFAIADPLAPFVVINDQDSKSAWSFTLLHELAHLWLGETGVSAGVPEHRVEQFCNSVAAEILVLPTELAALRLVGLSFEQQLELISRQADEWNVSRQMVTYGLFRADRIDYANWQALDGKLKELWQAERAREKESARGKKTGGPTYYTLRRHRLGRAMLSFVAHALNTGTLTPSKAGQVLGVAPRSVFPLLGNAP